MAVKKKITRMGLQRKKTAKKGVVKKAPLKRPAKKPLLKKPITRPRGKGKEKIVGVIIHYFPKVRAAVIKLKTSLAAGETIRIKGYTTDFKQKAASLQVDHVTVEAAKKGQEIGLLVDSRVREHDIAYKA